jgi:hypothetical protein
VVVLRFVAAVSAAALTSGCSRADPPPLVISQSSAGAYEAALRARDGGFVAAWYDTRDGNAEIYMRLLDDSGAPAGPERRLTNGPEHSYEASVATIDDAIAVAWYDKSADGTLVAKVGVFSFDGSNRWVAMLATRARNPVVARRGDDLFCAWIAAGSEGSEAVWGAWLQKTKADFTPLLLGPASKTTWNLNALVTDRQTAVVVYDAVAGTKTNEIFLADVGRSAARVQQLTEDDGIPSKYPDIAGSGRQALTWFDRRDGNEEVYLKVGTPAQVRDAAVKPVRVTTSLGASIGAYVAWADGAGDERIGLAWSDNSTDGQHEIYFQPFDPDGRVLAPARRMTTNSSASLIPAIVPAGDGFALAWNEYVSAADAKPASSQIAFTIVR